MKHCLVEGIHPLMADGLLAAPARALSERGVRASCLEGRVSARPFLAERWRERSLRVLARRVLVAAVVVLAHGVAGAEREVRPAGVKLYALARPKLARLNRPRRVWVLAGLRLKAAVVALARRRLGALVARLDRDASDLGAVHAVIDGVVARRDSNLNALQNARRPSRARLDAVGLRAIWARLALLLPVAAFVGRANVHAAVANAALAEQGELVACRTQQLSGDGLEAHSCGQSSVGMVLVVGGSST